MLGSVEIVIPPADGSCFNVRVGEVGAMLERSRFVVGDAAWEKIAPLLPGKASDPGRRPGTIGCSLKRCCGACGRACPGATCRAGSATGTASFSDFVAG